MVLVLVLVLVKPLFVGFWSVYGMRWVTMATSRKYNSRASGRHWATIDNNWDGWVANWQHLTGED
jgi:hypothetical protein